MKYDALKELQSVMEKYNIRFTVLDDYSLDIDWEDENGGMHETNVYSGDLRWEVVDLVCTLFGREGGCK